MRTKSEKEVIVEVGRKRKKFIHGGAFYEVVITPACLVPRGKHDIAGKCPNHFMFRGFRLCMRYEACPLKWKRSL